MSEKTIEDISISEANVDENESLRLLRLVHSRVDLVHYNEANYSEIIPLAETYINNHACVRSAMNVVYQSHPIYLFRLTGTKGRGEDVYYIEGLYYSNGAVVLTRINNPKDAPLVDLWIDKQTVRTFRYPEPKSVPILQSYPEPKSVPIPQR